jgi:hypothetical protein
MLKMKSFGKTMTSDKNKQNLNLRTSNRIFCLMPSFFTLYIEKRNCGHLAKTSCKKQ